MTRPILLLARLNEADLALDATKARLAEIVEATREPAELVRAKESLAAAQQEVNRLRDEQAQAERAQADADAKIAEIETRLYNGKTTTRASLRTASATWLSIAIRRPRSMTACSRSWLRWRRRHRHSTGAETDVARLTKEWTSRQSGLRVEYTRLKTRLPSEQARQASARQAVPAAFLRAYDHLRPRTRGRAVAELDGDVCSACRVQAPPSKLEDARFSDELVYCGNCGRLLWGE